METNTTDGGGKMVTVETRGCDMTAITADTKAAFQRLYSFTAMQVWTWRGGEALVVHDFEANYRRGEFRVIVRTGGTKRGTVKVLYANCFRDAMEQCGIKFRISTGRRPVRIPTAAELHRKALAKSAKLAGNMFRTLRARSSRIAAVAA